MMRHQIRDAWVKFGPLYGILYLLNRLLGRISDSVGLLAYDVVAQPIAYHSLNRKSSIEVRRIDPSEFAGLPIPVSSDVVAFRLDQGAVCLGAFRGNEFLAYIWFVADRFTDDEIQCTYVLPNSSGVFDLDVYIHPKHRMSRAFSVLWNGANQYLSDQGVKFSFSRISMFNTASRRAHHALGARRIATLHAIRLGGLQLMVSSMVPFIGFAWNGRWRPHFRLRSIAE